MGLSTDKRGESKNIYLKVMGGKLIQDVKAGTEGAETRTNKNGETVHELKYTSLTAKITNIAIIAGKFGKELEVKANADGQNFVLQMPAGSGYAYGFLTRMPNLDFTIDTEIVPFAIPEKKDGVLTGKTKNVVVLYQGKDEKGKAIKVESAFTEQNNFNGMPPLEKLKNPKDETQDLLVKGAPVWSDAARIEFFENIIYGEGGVNEKLISLYGAADATADVNETSDANAEINDDELEREESGAAVNAAAAKANATDNGDGKKAKAAKKK